MKNLGMILVGFICLGNVMALQAQEQSAQFGKLLKAINGSFRLSVKEFNGTAFDRPGMVIRLTHPTPYNANVSVMAETKKQGSGETINLKVNPANVVTVL